MTPSRTLQTKLIRLMLVIAIIVAVPMILYLRHQIVCGRAEEDAFDYVRMSGFISVGYTASLLTNLIDHFTPGPSRTRVGTTTQIRVGFPVTRMTENMAVHLINIRNLHCISLYPPDPDGRGAVFTTPHIWSTKSLRQIDLPLSEKNIVMLEEKFPDLVIQVASIPSNKTQPAPTD